VTDSNTLFDSLDDMLSIEAMSRLEGRTVTCVEVTTWNPPKYHAYSGCEFLKVRTSARDHIRRYVVKRTSDAIDIIRRLSEDVGCRERLIWQHGLLDRLPAEVASPIVACATNNDGCALLMRDVEEPLQRLERWRPEGLYQLNLDEISTVVGALTAMHARFYADPLLSDPALGLCSARQLFTWNSPNSLERHAAQEHWFVMGLRAGWDRLDRLDAPDVVAGIRALHSDPTPFLNALARFPSTLVHGDPRRENIGLTGDNTSRIVLIDWQFASAQPPAVDLAWLLCFYGPSPVAKESVIDLYRDQLALRLGIRFDAHAWEHQLRLALLGQCLRMFAGMLNNAYNSEDSAVRAAWLGHLPWWTEQARIGLQCL
jgi:hypothetical protein